MSEIILNDPGTISTNNPNVPLYPLGNEKQNANFELGVSMIIHFWPTLKTAVDNQWGGANSAEKRDWISGVIIDEFSQNDTIDIIYIHELLMGIMEDEFDTIIEDGSTISIGEKVIKVYHECIDSKFDNIKALYNKWLQRQQNDTKSIVNVGNDPLNPSDDEEEEGQDGDDDDGMDIDDDDYELQSKSQPKSKPEPVIDDDGFTVVTKGRR